MYYVTVKLTFEIDHSAYVGIFGCLGEGAKFVTLAWKILQLKPAIMSVG